MSVKSLPLRPSRPQSDLEALLSRMRQRLYPETMPVLASYWLKTVYNAGHDRAWWKELNHLLQQALREEVLNEPSREALIDIQTWVQETALLLRKAPDAPPSPSEPHRANPRPEWLAPYLYRLLNQWLASEVAGLLVNETELDTPQDGGIPPLAVGRSLERLLLRERLSPETLEILLRPEFLSPQYVYPAEAEMLADVALALLGRSWAPPPPVMPATVLVVANGTPLPRDYGEAVRSASLAQSQKGEEVHVPIAAAQALEILKGGPVRVASVIVTMDGRWWESDSLQSGDRHSVVYKPRGRLRIDYSADHAKLVIPWPDTQLCWPGAVRFRDPFEIFGREWQASSWETDGKDTWLHLVFSRALPTGEIQPAEDAGLPRSHPASVDMAWAALEDALATAVLQKSGEPIEQLRRSDFVPLGRSIFRLTELEKNGQVNREAIETQLRAIRYLQGEVSLAYGRVPWRILPAPVQSILLKRCPDPALLELLNQVFDGLPEALSETIRRRRPSQAA